MATMSQRDLEYMDPEEFRQLGILQEINRQFLHPIGLALAVGVDDSGRAVAIAGILDNRDDPEGFIYDFGEGMQEAIDKAIRFRTMRINAHERRLEKLGYIIQDFDWEKSDGQ